LQNIGWNSIILGCFISCHCILLPLLRRGRHYNDFDQSE
jgi:hypothetical protein